jgi:hypothetical protein
MIVGVRKLNMRTKLKYYGRLLKKDWEQHYKRPVNL